MGVVANVEPSGKSLAMPSGVRREIKALTGIRFVAAVWVLLFHLRGSLSVSFPEVIAWIDPLLSHGDMGVDLFFVLSGLILTYNYVDRMGHSFSSGNTYTFYCARIARVWPVAALTLMIALTWQTFLSQVGSPLAKPPEQLSVWSLFKQLFLVSLWSEPTIDYAMWNLPAWSVSAEALAYTLFPFVVLVIFRIRNSLSGWTIIALSFVALTPIPLLTTIHHSMYFPWGWLLRINCAFVAGALMCGGLQKIKISKCTRERASRCAFILTIVIAGYFYFIDLTDREWAGALVTPLILGFVGLLAVGEGSLVALLSTKTLVVGGAASYSIYMLHMQIADLFWFMEGNMAGFAQGAAASSAALLVLPFVMIGSGYMLWRWFEEPAREKIRQMTVPQLQSVPLEDIAANLDLKTTSALTEKRYLDREQ